MPNRMLRDWTLSDKVNQLSNNAERFFIRLIMKVDDYGCFHADTRVLKANLYPLLLDSIREADISRWMAECQKAGLIVLYEADSKKYLQIEDFRQRLDKAKSKYPLPTSGKPLTSSTESMAEVEVEPEVEKKLKEACEPPENFDFTKKEVAFYQELKKFTDVFPKPLLRAFYDYWREPNKSKTKMRYEQERTWDLSLRLQRWASKDKNFNNETDRKNNQRVTNVTANRKSEGATDLLHDVIGQFTDHQRSG